MAQVYYQGDAVKKISSVAEACDSNAIISQHSECWHLSREVNALGYRQNIAGTISQQSELVMTCLRLKSGHLMRGAEMHPFG